SNAQTSGWFAFDVW
ncbi:Ribose operon repressor, partial [Haemophilus influenzae]